jgi:hypothetical protein
MTPRKGGRRGCRQPVRASWGAAHTATVLLLKVGLEADPVC